MTVAVSAGRIRAFALVAAFLFAGLALLVPATGYAHEHREVGEYTLVVGFINEPAVQGDTNGMVIEVTKGDAPVTGLADTLKAQVIFGEQTRDLILTPAFGEDGTYEAVFIPTEPGDYTFRFYGTIEGVDVDETFTSSPEGFDSVQARADLEFPASDESGAGEDGATRVAMPLAVAGGALAVIVVGYAARRRAA